MDLTSALRVEEKEEFPHSCDHIEGIKGLLQALKLGECRHQLEYVVLKVLLFEVAVARGVVEGDLDAGLEEVDLANHIVEEGHYLDPAVLVPFKLEDC